MEPADPMLQGSGLVQFRLRCRMLAGQVFVENVEQTEPASTSTVVTMSRTRRLASFAPKLRVLQKNSVQYGLSTQKPAWDNWKVATASNTTPARAVAVGSQGRLTLGVDKFRFL